MTGTADDATASPDGSLAYNHLCFLEIASGNDRLVWPAMIFVNYLAMENFFSDHPHVMSILERTTLTLELMNHVKGGSTSDPVAFLIGSPDSRRKSVFCPKGKLDFVSNLIQFVQVEGEARDGAKAQLQRILEIDFERFKSTSPASIAPSVQTSVDETSVEAASAVDKPVTTCDMHVNEASTEPGSVQESVDMSVDESAVAPTSVDKTVATADMHTNEASTKPGSVQESVDMSVDESAVAPTSVDKTVATADMHTNEASVAPESAQESVDMSVDESAVEPASVHKTVTTAADMHANEASVAPESAQESVDMDVNETPVEPASVDKTAATDVQEASADPESAQESVDMSVDETSVETASVDKTMTTADTHVNEASMDHDYVQENASSVDGDSEASSDLITVSSVESLEAPQYRPGRANGGEQRLTIKDSKRKKAPQAVQQRKKAVYKGKAIERDIPNFANMDEDVVESESHADPFAFDESDSEHLSELVSVTTEETPERLRRPRGRPKGTHSAKVEVKLGKGKIAPPPAKKKSVSRKRKAKDLSSLESLPHPTSRAKNTTHPSSKSRQKKKRKVDRSSRVNPATKSGCIKKKSASVARLKQSYLANKTLRENGKLPGPALKSERSKLQQEDASCYPGESTVNSPGLSVASSESTEDWSISPFKEVWALLQKVGFKYKRDFHCLPGVNPFDDKFVLDRDYFDLPTRLRKHLCAYGIDNCKGFEWDKKQTECLNRWIRLANVHLPNDNKEVPEAGRTQIKHSEAISLLTKLGFSYSSLSSAYYLPGEEPNIKCGLSLNGRKLEGKDGLLVYLARFGLPLKTCAFKKISDVERLQLELFLAECKDLDVFTKHEIKPDDPPLFGDDSKSEETMSPSTSSNNIQDASMEENRPSTAHSVGAEMVPNLPSSAIGSQSSWKDCSRSAAATLVTNSTSGEDHQSSPQSHITKDDMKTLASGYSPCSRDGSNSSTQSFTTRERNLTAEAENLSYGLTPNMPVTQPPCAAGMDQFDEDSLPDTSENISAANESSVGLAERASVFDSVESPEDNSPQRPIKLFNESMKKNPVRNSKVVPFDSESRGSSSLYPASHEVGGKVTQAPSPDNLAFEEEIMGVLANSEDQGTPSSDYIKKSISGGLSLGTAADSPVSCNFQQASQEAIDAKSGNQTLFSPVTMPAKLNPSTGTKSRGELFEGRNETCVEGGGRSLVVQNSTAFASKPASQDAIVPNSVGDRSLSSPSVGTPTSTGEVLENDNESYVEDLDRSFEECSPLDAKDARGMLKHNDGVAMAPTKISIAKKDDWPTVYKKMIQMGWTYTRGTGLVNHLYCAPGGKLPRNGGRLDVDYVEEPFGLQKYAFYNLGWGGDELFHRHLDEDKSGKPNERGRSSRARSSPKRFGVQKLPNLQSRVKGKAAAATSAPYKNTVARKAGSHRKGTKTTGAELKACRAALGTAVGATLLSGLSHSTVQPSDRTVFEKNVDGIREFVRGAIQAEGAHGEKRGDPASLYVCGAPGVGKTSAVQFVCKESEEWASKRKSMANLDLPAFCFVNAAHMQQTSNASKYITEMMADALSLKGKAPTTEQVKNALDPSKVGRKGLSCCCLIMVVDEIELLLANGQASSSEKALSMLCDWSSTPTLRFALIGISNCIGNVHARRLQKFGLAHNTITFSSYKKEELIKIVKDRVREGIIDEKAIEFAAAKIASSSGDARKVLELTSRAVSMCLSSLSSNELEETTRDKPVVSIRHMMQAVKETIQKHADIIDGLPQMAKVILCVAVTLAEAGPAWHVIRLGTLQKYCYRAMETELEMDVSLEDFSGLVQQLFDAGLLLSGTPEPLDVSTLSFSSLYDQPVRLGVQLHDVESALEQTLGEQVYYRNLLNHVRSTDLNNAME